jgi:hypothetical protein
VFLSTFQCGEKILRNLLSKNEIGGIVKPDIRGGRNPGLLMIEEKKKSPLTISTASQKLRAIMQENPPKNCTLKIRQILEG